MNTKSHINHMLQETNKWNHGHCPCLRTQIPSPAFLPFPSHHMYQHTRIRSGNKFKTHCIKRWFIFRYIDSFKLVKNKQDFLAFSSSLILGCKAPWTSLLLSCKNTRTDHGSSDLDKDKLLWDCTSEMKFLIAAKPTKWLAANQKSSSIQVCPNWHCYSINYSVITYFLWWGFFLLVQLAMATRKMEMLGQGEGGKAEWWHFFCTGKLQALWLHYKAVLYKQFPLNAPICTCTICVPASTVIQPTLDRINA